MVRVHDAGRVSHRLNLIRDVFGAGALLARIKRRGQSRAQTAHSLGMLVDALESRTLLSTLPAPITTADTYISGPTTANANVNYSSPSIAYDPLDPMKVVAAYTLSEPSAARDQQSFIELSYSINGGATWTAPEIVTPFQGAPSDTELPRQTGIDYTASSNTEVVFLAEASNASVAFNRAGDVYLVWAEHATDSHTGQIMEDEFNFNGTTLNTTNPLITRNVVYSWIYGFGALNPSLAVNDNVASFTDQLGNTSTDPSINAAGVGSVYVSWNTQYYPPPGTTAPLIPPFNPNTIQLTGSSDGGNTWSSPIFVNTGGYFPPNINTRDGFPQLAISQGGSNNTQVTPGQINVVWDDYGKNSPQSTITSDSYSPLVSQTVTAVSADNTMAAPWVPINYAIGTVAPETPVTTTIPFTVTATGTVTSVDLDLAILDPNLDQLQAVLIAPNGTRVILFNNGVDDTGATIGPPPQGLTGSNLGINTGLDYSGPYENEVVGTELVSEAQTPNSLTGGSSPWTDGTYSVEADQSTNFNDLSKFAGVTAAGNWQLQITDYYSTTNPMPQQVELAALTVNSGLNNLTGNKQVAETYVQGSWTNQFSTANYTPSPNLGIGPDPVIASDNTLGTYSQHQGRIYVSYVYKTQTATTNTNIALAYSDNGGASWTIATTKVNDDADNTDGSTGASGNDNDPTQFEPAIAVDQANGTLVMTWYDARDDAADARVARYITTSIDGGATFGAQTYLNQPNTVYDAITGDADNLGPIPDNFSTDAVAAVGEGLFSEGTSQGLAVFDGRVYAAWTGNENDGPLGNASLDILTSTTTYASGPRIISSTEGVVSTPEDIVNPAQDLGGTTGFVPAFQYIDVTFDRGIIPSSLTASDIDIQYRNDSTPGSQPPTDDISNLISSITPLNLGTTGEAQSDTATEFRIGLSAPQTDVGTYSYYILPAVSAGYEYFGLGGTNSTVLTASSAITNAQTGQSNLVVPAIGSAATSSTIQVPAAYGNNQEIVDVQVNVQFNGPIDALSQFVLTLTGTDNNGDAVSVILASDELGASQRSGDATYTPDLAGHGYVATTFDDESDEPIADGNFQFSGTYHPTGNLAAFDGITLAAGGQWKLTISSSQENSGSVPVGLLQDWSIQFQTETQQTNETLAPYSGNIADQNSDAIPSQAASFAQGFQTTGDLWAMPTPTADDSYTSSTNNYFAAPFESGTSAIIVPGPSLAAAIEYPSANIPVTIAATAGSTVTSTITIGSDPTEAYNLITDLVVKLQITYPHDHDLVITLISPDGTPITLAALTPSNGANFGSTSSILGPTVFADDAANPINNVNSSAPFVGLYAPVTPLSDLNGTALAGAWTLQIQNIGGSSTGTLNSWSLTASTQTSPTDLNNGLSQMVVQFDRNMDPTTISAANILSMTGPLGPITGAFTIAPDPDYDTNYPDPDASNARTYLITFPTQTLTGTYTLNLAPTSASPLESTDGTPLDSDQNAGVDMLNDTATSTVSHTYTNSVPININPSYTSTGIITSTVTVPVTDGALIQGITVTLDITYPHADELSAVLVSPQGISIQLFGNLASGGALTGQLTTFSDSSGVQIANGSAPFFGSYDPQQPLSTLLDTNSAGTWTLLIKNDGASGGTTAYQLKSWSLALKTASPDTGAGTTTGDQATTSFNLFNLGATDDQSHEVWAPVGGSVNTGSNSAAGPVTAIAVDPSDPSGNTVYIGAATGGVWRTTNFLTTDPDGPTYEPLTPDAPTGGLNIGSITVLGSQTNPATGDTVPSMIFAATGNGNTTGMSPGVGILVSVDGGQTWNVATGLTNTDSSGAWLSSASGSRDNTFEGLDAYQIVVDPHLQPNGDAIIYVAFSDPNGSFTNGVYSGNGGIYRSVDSGKTWTLMRAGQATSIVLDLNSGVPNFTNTNSGDNVNAVVAAFAGEGVFRSPNRGVTWNELLGDIGDPDLLNYDDSNHPAVTLANEPNPNGDNGRIVLAMPALTGNPIEDVLYEGWIYAAVVSNTGGPTGTLVGLYMTKDYGQTWTEVQIDGKILNGVITQNPDNDSNTANAGAYSPTNGQEIPQGDGNYAIALSVDPNNPNVVYLGGSSYANNNQDAGMIRIDTTGIADSHAYYQGENGDDGGKIEADTTNVVALEEWANVPGGGVGVYPDSVYEPTINLLQNPSEPFTVGSAVRLNNIGDIANSGANITWIPFDSAFDYTNAPTNQAVTAPSEYHEILSEIDPQTGLTRLIIATDQGVYSAVDDDGTYREPSVNEQEPSGTAGTITTSLNEPASGSRNGNLQIAELFYGAVQPSQTSADAAGGLFYGEGQGVGLISSSPDILSNGDTTWTGAREPSGGTGVATDQTGAGTVYDYTNPRFAESLTDFFEVNGVGRTTGLLTSTAGPNPTNDAQWPATENSGDFTIGSDFAVNPVNGDEIVISSQNAGQGPQIFSTENQGQNWNVIATQTDLDGTYAPALAYGAPTTGNPVDTFIYAGTTGGNIYVTFTGGGNGSSNNWINISNGLDGSSVEAIVTDPNHNTFDAYAVTQDGVYYMPNSSAANPTWINITGNLLSLTHSVLGNALYTELAVQMLTSLVADWRYASPILYVGADAGVYQGLDQDGTWTWQAFPNASSEDATVAGGDLPNVEVSDLDLAVGAVDPSTGLPHTTANDPDVLMASTFGDGAYAIRLAPIVSDLVPELPSSAPSNDKLILTGTSAYATNSPTLTVTGSSEENIPGFNSALISVYELDSNGNPVEFLGGYNPSDTSTSTSDPNGADNPANIANTSGDFSITTTTALPANGTFTIGVRATDNAGVQGAFEEFSVSVATTPPTITGFDLTPATDTGPTTTPGVRYTKDNPPAVTGTVVNESAPSESETGTIVAVSVDGTQVGTAVVGSNNTFTYTLPAALSQGTHTISAIATDPVGNVSAQVSFILHIITSIATPSAPVLAPASDSGISNSDDLTNVKLPTFTGTASANDAITLFVNGTADGTATADSSGNYSITIPTALTTDGVYAITVSQTDIADNVSSVSPALSVTLDTTPPVVAAVPITANQYGTFTGTVGTITDLHPDGTATITWGDGATSAGTLVATSSPTVYDIQGSHVYQTTGTFSISITATDAAGNSASTPSSGTGSGSGSVTVTPPAPAVTAIALNVNEGQVLTLTPVASFTNGAPNPNINDFTATINWGDGSPSTTGTIVADPDVAGYFLVEGSHTYTDGPHTYTTTITVNATGVANPSTATGTATVANVPPTVTLGGTTTGFINQIIILPITTTDPGSADTAAGFTYNINWGDGTTQTIGATTNNGTGQSPTHVYSTAGNYTITVTATDKDGGVGTVTRALQIATAPSLSNVVINYGQTQRSHIDNISFDLSSTTVPITSLDTTDLALVFDGETVVSLANAVVTFDASTGHVSINLQGVSLNNGDYQLFVFPGTGVLPINFTKLTGDTNGDGFITKTDVNTVKADLGATAGSPNYNPDADVNGDGVVNSTDLALLQLDKVKKIQTKVIKLIAGKVIKPVSLHFATMATNATRAVPIQLELVNSDPSRPLTLTDVSLLGGGSNFSFAVLNQTYGATTFTIPPGGTLTIRMYFTPSGAATFTTQLKAQLSNDVQSTYGAVIAKFTGKATAPKKSK
jgi:subtilisin-like proprotein convertase family protein